MAKQTQQQPKPGDACPAESASVPAKAPPPAAPPAYADGLEAGRGVRYFDPRGSEYGAIATRVNADDTLSLAVFSDRGGLPVGYDSVLHRDDPRRPKQMKTRPHAGCWLPLETDLRRDAEIAELRKQVEELTAAITAGN